MHPGVRCVVGHLGTNTSARSLYTEHSHKHTSVAQRQGSSTLSRCATGAQRWEEAMSERRKHAAKKFHADTLHTLPAASSLTHVTYARTQVLK